MVFELCTVHVYYYWLRLRKMQLDIDVSQPADLQTELDPHVLSPLTSKITWKPVQWDLKLHFWPDDLELYVHLDVRDLWPWPTWPLTLTQVTLDLQHFDLVTLTYRVDLRVIHIHDLTKFHGPRSNGLWDMNFGLVTDIHVIHTESDAYEPTVPLHRWAQKCNLMLARNLLDLRMQQQIAFLFKYHAGECSSITWINIV